MYRLFALLISLILAVSSAGARPVASQALKDSYFGEALYYALQGRWFDAVARLDAELAQHHGLDEPERDTLYYHINHAEFAVGDFELAYRMHHRAGRAITRVIEGNVAEPVRNEAIFRLARIYFQKDQPVNALYAVERIKGVVPVVIRDDLNFLRAQILMANKRYGEASRILKELLAAKSLEGFSTYNLGIALLKEGNEQEGRHYLDRTGRIAGADPATAAIRDKSKSPARLQIAERAKLHQRQTDTRSGSAFRPIFQQILVGRGLGGSLRGTFRKGSGTLEYSGDAGGDRRGGAGSHVGRTLRLWQAERAQQGCIDVWQRAYDIRYRDRKAGRFNPKHSRRVLSARLGTQRTETGCRLGYQVAHTSANTETYYLIELMASHDFQESLKNYLDLEELRKKLRTWEGDLHAFEELIAHRRDYYQPLLPVIDQQFRRLDSQMRLLLEQRNRIEQRLQAMLVAPRPDYLATASERIFSERLAHLERKLTLEGAPPPKGIDARIRRLRGVLEWNIHTEYDRRLTEAHTNLHELNHLVDLLKRQYTAFVRARQAARQSYEGYDEGIREQRRMIRQAGEKVGELMTRQGNMLEVMAVNELGRRRERLVEFQIKARFALADSYDRAARAQTQRGWGNEPEPTIHLAGCGGDTDAADAWVWVGKRQGHHCQVTECADGDQGR
jgi:hypothetical protein